MKKQINDIRIKTRGKTHTNSVGAVVVLPHALDKKYFVNSKNFAQDKKQEKPESLENKIDNKEFINGDRRNFLKIVAASGGIFIAGNIINKVSKMGDFSLGNQGASALGSIFGKKSNNGTLEQKDEDLNSFFQNFRIVKNDKEYILYNKEGDNILIIDRDA